MSNTLFQTIDIGAYRSTAGRPYVQPTRVVGYTVIQVLPELWGTQLCDATLALIHGLLPRDRPGWIRVTRGEITTNFSMWRVTVYVDEAGVIQQIEQEVECLYDAGDTVQAAVRELQQRKRRYELAMDTDELCDFEVRDLATDHGDIVAIVPRTGDDAYDRTERQALVRRIVACLNACEGVRTDVLKELGGHR